MLAKTKVRSVSRGDKISANSGYFLKAQLTGFRSSPLNKLVKMTKFDIHKAKLAYASNLLKTSVQY